MKKCRLVCIVVVLLVAPLLAKEPNPNDFPEQFFVRQAAPGSHVWITGQDNRPICYMELESGDMHYSVSRRAPTAFQRCHMLVPGQTVMGRRKSGTIELLLYDGKSGKGTVQKWGIENMYTVQDAGSPRP